MLCREFSSLVVVWEAGFDREGGECRCVRFLPRNCKSAASE